jgi:Tfp pilus assembly protein PilV
MVMKHTLLRPAIAMIELIFAIVVMGIAMLSVPLMLDTASKSSAVAFQQESIAIIASHANAMMTYAWDEQNTQPYNPNSILITHGDNELDGNTNNTAALNAQRSKIATAASLPASFGANKDMEAGSILHPETVSDDIDDFDRTEANLTIAEAGTQLTTSGDYMDIGIKVDTRVIYLDDTAANYQNCNGNVHSGNCAFSKNNSQWTAALGTTNIKLITTTLTSSNVTDKQIVLHAFMCNIGATNQAGNLRTF